MSSGLTPSDLDLSALPLADRSLGRMAQDPRLPVYGAVGLAALVGWTYLVLMVFGSESDPAALGPGMTLLAPGFAYAENPWLAALCAPLGIQGAGAGSAALVTAMWAMMVLAMMIPSAAPMLSTYATLADTAARKQEPAAPVWILASGYLVVWLAFAVVAAGLQIALAQAGILSENGTAVVVPLAGIVLLAAGAYQFSSLKHACLTKCRNPFAFFFARWTETRRGVFRLGLLQGAFCLGCCWALMAVMFAVGVMNLVWIAALAMLMTIEKRYAAPWISSAIGVFLLGVGGTLIVASLYPTLAAAL